jgi:hypothetical protein
METGVIRDCKALIENSSLQALQLFYNELMQDKNAHLVDWAFVLQKVYLHACLKKKQDMVTWLEARFKDLDPIQFMAYRHTLNYGRHLLRK